MTDPALEAALRSAAARVRMIAGDTDSVGGALDFESVTVTATAWQSGAADRHDLAVKHAADDVRKTAATLTELAAALSQGATLVHQQVLADAAAKAAADAKAAAEAKAKANAKGLP